jgi:hypothetical protein
VKKVLTDCLKEFFAKDQNWKWIPGRDLIGATLQSLAKTGDKQTALLIIQYIRNPGCDFLYQELRSCLSAIGRPAVSELVAVIREDLNENIYDWGRLILLEALGDIGDPQAVPFFIELLGWQYHDQYQERDFKGIVLQGLGKLKAYHALDIVARELMKGRNEIIRQAAASALGQIGGVEAFAILEEKLKSSDNDWVVRECLTSLNSIAFNEIKTNGMKLKASKIMLEKRGSEAAFQLMYQSMCNGEEWPIDLFFEIIDDVPMQRNYHNVVELLNTNNIGIFTKTISFLEKLTKLSVNAEFDGSARKKEEAKQKFYDWFCKNTQNL